MTNPEAREDRPPFDDSSQPGDVADAIVEDRQRLSIVWLVPLVAAVIGGWLAYVTISEQGPHITVSFETADGLEADKTKVKFRDVEVGHVTALQISDDRRSVLATIDVEKSAEKYLTETTQFWVVRPRLDASGVSGLSTLISGAYIEIQPGSPGKAASKYVALETPPVVRPDAPGSKYVLQSDTLGSLSPRTPVYFRGIRVGEVLGYELTGDHSTVHSYIFIKEPFDGLVLESSNFWVSGGVEVSAGTDGFSVRIGSLQSLLAGGIEFDSPAGLRASEPASENHVFTLFQNHEAIAEAAIAEKIPYSAYFDGSVRGLRVGAPVEFRGIRIGTVSRMQPEIDLKSNTIKIGVLIDLEPQRLRPMSTVAGEQDYKKYALIAALVEKGLRAQLQTASLLTGQQIIGLDFFPDDPPKVLGSDGPAPEIPTVPPQLEGMASAANRLLGKLSNLPLDATVADIRKAVTTLDATLQDTRALVQSVNKDVAPMIVDFRKAATAAQVALQQAERTTVSFDRSMGESSDVQQQLSQMLREITDSARSLRQLADFLERNPDALIRGKNDELR
jgi:paraquat-inducible protein B